MNNFSPKCEIVSKKLVTNSPSTDERRRISVIEHMDPEADVPGGIDSIIHGLIKHGHSVDFSIVGITGDRSKKLGTWTSVDFAGKNIPFLPVAHLDRTNPRGIIRFIPHSIVFLAGVVWNHRKIGTSETHVHRIETGFISGFLGFNKIVQFIHNDSNGLLGPESDSFWRNFPKVYRYLEKRTLETCAKVVLFNRTDSARVKDLRNDVLVSRTWFEPDMFSPRPDTTPRTDLPLKIVWVGRLESQKDPELAVEVMESLNRRGIAAELTIVGSGSLTNLLREKIRSSGLESQVILAGALPRHAVAEIMRDSDALLLTSRYEGSPVVLLEANSSGTPVIATVEADPDHALHPERNGIRVPNRNSSKLADALAEVRSISRAECARLASERSATICVPALLGTLNC